MTIPRWTLFAALLFLVMTAGVVARETVFQIGRPDGMSAEFRKGIPWDKFNENKKENQTVYRFVVGKNRTWEWLPMHLSTRDFKNAGWSYNVEIEFRAVRDYDKPLYLIVGAAYAHPSEPSLIHLKINGKEVEPQRQPKAPRDMKFKGAIDVGIFEATVLEIPAGVVKQGTNLMVLTLKDGSWLHYDYLLLSDSRELPEQLPPPDLKKQFLAGPMQDVKEIVFAVRKPGDDPHWYANFGYYAASKDEFPFPLGSGGFLCALNLETGKVRSIFKDKEGSIRDPQVHYSGKKIIFSYLPAGKRHFNLYEINSDGSGLRQITKGDWDDIEPTYTPSGDIIFCSSRAKRWVQCWLTPVATMHRCGPNGENIREVSANVEHDNTPWPLQNGQILYTRWEYVDRSQVHFHHLWSMNPDGTRQMVYYGNLHPGLVMIDAKPIPNSQKIVVSFSPGHGRKEHMGQLAIVDPRLGPDHPDGSERLTNHSELMDPWAFSEQAFMAARQNKIQLLDVDGYEQTLYELPDEMKEQGYWIHEPRPLQPRPVEVALADQTNLKQSTGRLALVDIYQGRKMEGVKRGSIKELLVLETLSEPIHYSGGMDQISRGGTFTLERIVGTIPVEPDGSAYMELPALRSFLFVAMDHAGRPVKRMHSFTSVMPGETTTCIGCHEHRMQAPDRLQDSRVMQMLGRRPHQPRPITDIPDVFDFPRDIQPILDKHCIACHNDDRRDGGVNLLGDWGPQYTFSYLTLSYRNLLGDNRNRPQSNFEPYEIGSSASRLLKLIEEKHADVNLSAHEQKMIRYWLDAGANYAGTYAANGTGQIGWPYMNKMVPTGEDWPETKAMSAMIGKQCGKCHNRDKKNQVPHTLTHGTNYDRNFYFNLSYPEKSRVLRGPLVKEQGGFGRCKDFSLTKDDEAYKVILAGIERGRRYILEESNRFSMKPFIANAPYTREMIRYGVLPPNHDPKSPIDPYATDRKYWEMLWYKAK